MWKSSSSGRLCSNSHPIPCGSGAFCTSMMRPSDPNYCSIDGLKNGSCCPEKTVPCKYSNPNYSCQAHPKYGMFHGKATYENLNHSPYPHRPGLACPQTHPIPCKGGSHCTNRQLSYNESNCQASAIANGLCCPEDAIPCNADDPNYLCRANPHYGRGWMIL